MVVQIERSIENHTQFWVSLNISNQIWNPVKEINCVLRMNLKARDLLQFVIVVVVVIAVFRFLMVITTTLEITFHFSTYLSIVILAVTKATTLRQVYYFYHLFILHFFIINYFHLAIKQDTDAQLISVREHSAEVQMLLSKNQKSLMHSRSAFLTAIQRILTRFWKKYCCWVFQHTNLV